MGLAAQAAAEVGGDAGVAVGHVSFPDGPASRLLESMRGDIGVTRGSRRSRTVSVPATPGLLTPGLSTPGNSTPGWGTPGPATPGARTPGGRERRGRERGTRRRRRLPSGAPQQAIDAAIEMALFGVIGPGMGGGGGGSVSFPPPIIGGSGDRSFGTGGGGGGPVSVPAPGSGLGPGTVLIVGREGGREGGRDGGREVGREGNREGNREGGREGVGREGVGKRGVESFVWSSDGSSEAVDATCCVCLCAPRRAAFIPCGHTFCRGCARQLAEARARCPLCNRRIRELLRLY